MPLFLNRRHAGRLLAEQVKSASLGSNILVLVLPRGGAPVGFEVAQSLHAEMDVFLVRKLGVPGQQELAFGAIASGGVRVLNREVVDYFHLADQVIEEISARETVTLEAREQFYREGKPPSRIAGRIAVLVDDGLATGASMIAAVRAVRRQGARQTVVAVPVAAREACADLGKEADQVICAATPGPFSAVGAWYEDFTQVTDEEVRRLLEEIAQTARIENSPGRIQSSEGSL